MKFIYVCVLSFTILIYSGCSNKNVQIESTNSSVEKVYEEDAFLDEFADEMKVEKKSDPFSGYNRMMTSFNDGLYEYVLAPTARSYKNIVHEEIRGSVGNFFHNILYPIRLVNNVLQGKIKNSGEETGRFIINSTIGILGLFDPAKSYFELVPHNEDFGQTLGYWGVGAGPHIVLPFLGPSNLRDTLSLYPTSLVNPVDYQEDRNYNLTNNYDESLGLKVFKTVNYLSLHEGEYEKLKKDAVDLYPYLRDVYEQYREKQIRE
ncbi:MAG: phospholipid-binding lipoprotein MlaA [Arcobacteraceae bacterium]|jgi:phospholipid-binding lipoprotein MlaA